MKNSICLSLLLLFSLYGFSQHLRVGVGAEKTVSGTEYMSSVRLQNKKMWAAGIFYQSAFSKAGENMTSRDEFMGISLSAPLVVCERIAFQSSLRAGIISKQFLVVVPGLETQIRLTKHLNISVGISSRKGFVAANTSLSVKL